MKYFVIAGLCCFFSFNVTAQKPYATFNHIAIYVKNLDKSVSFYSKLFQFDSIPDPFPERRITWFKIGEYNQLHIIQSMRDTIIAQDTYHFCFSVADVNEFVERLSKLNIDYVGADMKTKNIVSRNDGKKQIWIKDPDGYMVEVNDDQF